MLSLEDIASHRLEYAKLESSLKRSFCWVNILLIAAIAIFWFRTWFPELSFYWFLMLVLVFGGVFYHGSKLVHDYHELVYVRTAREIDISVSKHSSIFVDNHSSV